ncbi:MAG: hypothetical protein ACREMY_04700 [bacterium]
MWKQKSRVRYAVTHMNAGKFLKYHHGYFVWCDSILDADLWDTIDRAVVEATAWRRDADLRNSQFGSAHVLSDPALGGCVRAEPYEFTARVAQIPTS